MFRAASRPAASSEFLLHPLLLLRCLLLLLLLIGTFSAQPCSRCSQRMSSIESYDQLEFCCLFPATLTNIFNLLAMGLARSEDTLLYALAIFLAVSLMLLTLARFKSVLQRPALPTAAGWPAAHCPSCFHPSLSCSPLLRITGCLTFPSLSHSQGTTTASCAIGKRSCCKWRR